MTINVLVYKLAFKKNQEKYTSSLSNREANTRKLVHRSSTFQPQFYLKNIQKKSLSENRTRAHLPRYLPYHYTTTLTICHSENFHYKIIDLYTDFHNKGWQ